MLRTGVVLALLACVMGFQQPVSAAEGVVSFGDVVRVEVGGSTSPVAGPPAVDCSGFAPQEATCVGTFTVPDADSFGIRIAAGPGGYSGTIEVHAQSSTSFTSIVCDVLIVGRCYYQQVGFYVVGQPVTLTGVASGFGNWIIQAPV
jgi:hypothetical protein